MNSSFHPCQAQMLQNHTQHMLENSHQPMEYVHAHAVGNPLNHRQMGQQVINLSREILSRNHPRLEDMHFEIVDDVCGQSHGFPQPPASAPLAGGASTNVQTFNRDGLQFSVTTRINVSCEQIIYIPGHPGYSTRTQGGAHFHTTSSSSQPPETVYSTSDGSNSRGSNRAVAAGIQTHANSNRQFSAQAIPMRAASSTNRRYMPYSAPVSQRQVAVEGNVDIQSGQSYHSFRHSRPYRVNINEFSTQTEQEERKPDQSCSPTAVRRLPLDEFLARDVISKAKSTNLKEEVQRQCSLLLGERYKEGEDDTVKTVLSKTNCCKDALVEAVYRLRGGDLDVGLECTKLCGCKAKTESADNSNESTSSPSHENPMCAICHEDYACGNMLRTLPCGHRYHMECIDKWLFTKSSACPLCKRDCNDKNCS